MENSRNYVHKKSSKNFKKFSKFINTFENIGIINSDYDANRKTLYWSGYVDCMLDSSLDQFQSYSDAYNCADLFDFHCEKEQDEKFTLQYELACMAVIIHGGGDGCD